MRLTTIVLGLASVQQATSAVVEKKVRFTEADVLRLLRENPNVLPHNAQLMLDYKTKNVPMDIQKRSPQSSTLVALFGSLQNTVSSFWKPWPKATIPDIREVKSPKYPEAMRKTVRYGPYRIPPTSEQNVEFHLMQAQGMTNTLKIGASKPCAGKECMILNIKASLENADGSKVPSNVQGAWLHHVVLLNAGMEVKDATCGGMVEHVFESGNEKSDVPFYSPVSGIKSGYHVRNNDIFSINTELMNMEDKEKWAWLALDFDYIEGFKSDWREGKIVWMSVGPDRCTGSDWNPFGPTNLTRTQQPIKQIFEEYSVPWKSPRDGVILGSNSHLHDGGIDTKVFLDNQAICTSVATYSDDAPGGMAGGMMGSSGGNAAPKAPGGHSHARRQMGAMGAGQSEHIAKQGECEFKEPMPMKKGQGLFIKSTYDFTKHAGMKNARGELDEVMAIAGALVAFDYNDWQSSAPAP